MDKYVLQSSLGPTISTIALQADCVASGISLAAQSQSTIASAAAGISDSKMTLGPWGGIGHIIHIHPNLPKPTPQPDMV
jgi:hypothetical protein